MSWLKDSILILCQFQLMRLRRTKPPKMLWWSQNEKSQLKAQAGLHSFIRTRTNALNRFTCLSSKSLSWNNHWSLECELYALFKCSVHKVCITGAATTLGSTPGWLNSPFSGELGVDELVKRRVALRAGWSQLRWAPTLPCIGEVMWLSGSLWGCKGLLQQGLE